MPLRRHGGMDTSRQRGQPSGVADGVDGVEAQAVEAEFIEPVERVVDEEIADLGRRDIDRRTPRGVRRLVEERRGIGPEVIAFGTEVVVDDVEEDHEAQPVRRVDQRLQVVGRPIRFRRRERQHAVITPVAPSGKFRDGHQLDRGDSERRQVRQQHFHAMESTQQARVQFVDHGLAPRASLPRRVPPCVTIGVDDHAIAMDIATCLPLRGGIGNRRAAVDAETIERTGQGGTHALEPAIVE